MCQNQTSLLISQKIAPATWSIKKITSVSIALVSTSRHIKSAKLMPVWKKVGLQCSCSLVDTHQCPLCPVLDQQHLSIMYHRQSTSKNLRITSWGFESHCTMESKSVLMLHLNLYVIPISQQTFWDRKSNENFQ